MVNSLTSIEIASATAASGGTVNCALNYVYSLNGVSTTVTSLNYSTNKDALDPLLLGKTVLIMYNDIGVSGISSVQGSIPFNPFDTDGDLLFTKQLSLSAGKKYAFYASLSDGTAYSTDTPLETVTVIDTPTKAQIAVTPLDSALSVKIAYPSSSPSIYDGYSPITSVQITVTGVFTLGTQAISKVYHFPIAAGDYTTDMQISTLLNGNSYEVISTFFNAAGPSPMSSSVAAVPSDTPDVITNTSGYDRVFAISKIQYDAVKNVPTNKGIVVYSTWPTDKPTLEAAGLKITRVKVILTTLKLAVNGTSWSADDDVLPVEKEYLLPSTAAFVYTSSDGIYNSAGFDTYTGANVIPFRFILTDVDVGTAVKANVVFGNDNGYPGQNGSFTQNVMSMLCPEQPALSGHVIPNSSTCTFEIYRTALPATNGGKANKYRITGSIVPILGPSTNMSETANAEFTSTPFTINPTTTVNVFKYSVTAPTIGSTYNYNFETITEDPFDNTKFYYSNLAPISLISKQTISSYKQIQVRSWNNDGTPVLISGNPGIYFNFKAELLTNLAFHGGVNGSSITANDVSIRLAKNSQLVPTNDFPAKQHPGSANVNTPLTYNIPQSVSSLDQYYIRVVVIDRQHTSIDQATGLPNAPDTKELISVDSSPSLSMASESYMPPVQSLTIVRNPTDATKATLKYTKPNDLTTFGICGFNPSIDTGSPDSTAGTIKILTRRAHNAIVVIDDLTGLKDSAVIVKMPIVPLITTTTKTTDIIPWNYVKSGNNVELELTGLFPGKSYTVYALSGMYTTQAGYYLANGNASGTNEFQGFIRQNYTSYSFVAASPAAAPSSFNVYGKNNGLYEEWTAPLSFSGASLKQYEISAFNYGDGVADTADGITPLFTEATQNPVYSTTNNYALVNSVWPSRAAGNLGTGSKIPLVNGDIIKTGIRTVTEIPVKNLLNSSFSVTSADLNMGLTDNPPAPGGAISYTSKTMNTLSSVIEPRTLIGSYTTSNELGEPNVEPAAPQGLSAASSSGQIAVSFLKATDGLSDEVRIITDGTEAIFTKRFKETGNYLGVDFTSAFAASGAGTGLLFIQAVFANVSSLYSTNHNTVYNKIITLFGGVVNGNFVFKIQGINGQTKTIGVMYVDVNSFSNEDTLSTISIITAAASAPPSIVRYPKFTVSNNLLSLSWTIPDNIGGAGISVGTGKANNSDLKYQIDIFMNAGDKDAGTASVSYSMKDISALSLDIALPNNTVATYYANIVAYYYNESIITSQSIDKINNTAWFNSTNNTSALAQPIKVGPTPNQGSTSALALSSQSIAFNYTLPAPQTSYAYPINLLGVYVDDFLTKYYTFNSSTGIVGANETSLSTAKAAAVSAAGTFAASSTVPITLGSVNGLFNGGKYKVSVKPMGIYTYAQMPPQSEQFNLTPYASIQIDSTSVVSSDKRRITAVVKMNGDELKSAIIIGRDADRVNYVQPILTGTAFYSKSGIAVGGVVANQTATFTSIDFTNPMEGFLIIVNGQNTSDIDDIPDGTFGVSIPQ